ncbi:TetR/AcrR family transcriptional regulator [Thermomonas sp.]|uniref:TetR/AcrR family transcriptional regulator n=1 Tax=Thermomonas sp. TaxID=1971895 RepID=UPI0031BB2087
MIATFWLNYASARGDKDERAAIRDGIVQVMMLLSPFLRDAERVHLNTLTRAYLTDDPLVLGERPMAAITSPANPITRMARLLRIHRPRRRRGRDARRTTRAGGAHASIAPPRRSGPWPRSRRPAHPIARMARSYASIAPLVGAAHGRDHVAREPHRAHGALLHADGMFP